MQKIAQNDKQFCLSHSISLFLVHMCKRIISPGVFPFFQSFNFLGRKGSKRGKNDPKWMSVALRISGSIHHTIVIFGTHVWNDYISRWFFQFFKILIFRLGRGVKGQKRSKMAKNSVRLTPFLRNRTWYFIFGTCVKWWYLQQFFSFFQNSDFRVFKVVLVCSCKTMIYPGVFFFIF